MTLDDGRRSDAAEETYLGDGLYARLETPDTLRLRAPREDGDHIVYLSPMEYSALRRLLRDKGQGGNWEGHHV